MLPTQIFGPLQELSLLKKWAGPKITWSPGRCDKPDGSYCPENGRLPDASQGESHVREVFYRMGFNDREMVALIGAHTLGRCHTKNSGFDGPGLAPRQLSRTCSLSNCSRTNGLGRNGMVPSSTLIPLVT